MRARPSRASSPRRRRRFRPRPEPLSLQLNLERARGAMLPAPFLSGDSPDPLLVPRLRGDRIARGRRVGARAVGQPQPFVARLALVVERADHRLAAGNESTEVRPLIFAPDDPVTHTHHAASLLNW